MACQGSQGRVPLPLLCHSQSLAICRYAAAATAAAADPTPIPRMYTPRTTPLSAPPRDERRPFRPRLVTKAASRDPPPLPPQPLCARRAPLLPPPPTLSDAHALRRPAAARAHGRCAPAEARPASDVEERPADERGVRFGVTAECSASRSRPCCSAPNVFTSSRMSCTSVKQHQHTCKSADKTMNQWSRRKEWKGVGPERGRCRPRSAGSRAASRAARTARRGARPPRPRRQTPRRGTRNGRAPRPPPADEEGVRRGGARLPRKACPFRTGGGTRRVQLVREEGRDVSS